MVKTLIVQKDGSGLETMITLCLSCVVRQTTRLFNNGKNPGLVVIITIGTHSKVNLVFKSIFLVRRSQLKDALKNRQLLGIRVFGGTYHTCLEERAERPAKVLSPKSMDCDFHLSRKMDSPDISTKSYLLGKMRSSMQRDNAIR